ncbi:MAG: DUF4912 domain-containing protein [Firmicutes bacterium]|nr:DUF4912 domain-containing protein [Bacillota bacterium]
MNALYPWLFIAIFLVLAAGIFLLPSLFRRPARKSKLTAPARLLKEEYSTELSPEVRPEPLPPAAKPQRPPEIELPRSYGVDRIALMARDPHWLFAYWEITATRQEEFAGSYGPAAWALTRQVLRVYDVTGVAFNGENAHSYIDVHVGEQADNWHIHVGKPDRSFCVDLGRMFPDGKFVTLLRSNVVTTPRASLSDRLDEEWMWLESLYYSIGRFRYGTSSPMIIEEMAGRAGLGALPLGISSPGFSRPPEH